jgi:hypothetical protein
MVALFKIVTFSLYSVHKISVPYDVNPSISIFCI